MLTYAQNFEDVMLERLFEGQSGFYIDIGAWDPDSHSVTRHFYGKGWRGINIEPIASRYELFQKARPRDINLNIAIGESRTKLRFFECLEESYLSTLDQAAANDLKARDLTVSEYDVDVVPLMEVIREYCPDEVIDFLKIDIEGFEEVVLRSIDFNVVRPRVLIIEATLPATRPSSWDNVAEISNWASWENYVLDHGYEFAYFDGLNRFYLRSEDAALRIRFGLPPGVYDLIEYPRTLELESEGASRLKQVEELTQIHHVSQNEAGARISVLEVECAERLAQVEELTHLIEDTRTQSAAKISVLEAECAERLAQIEKLTNLIEDARAQSEARISTLQASISSREQECEERLIQVNKLTILVEEQRASTQATISSLQNECDQRLKQIHQLHDSIAAMETDRADRLDVINTLTGQNAQLEQDKTALETRVQYLETSRGALKTLLRPRRA